MSPGGASISTRHATGPMAASRSATPTWSMCGCEPPSACRLKSDPEERRSATTMMKRAEAAIPAGPPDDAPDSVDARVSPTGSLENLSQMEVDRLLSSSRGGLYPLYRRCSLAVLNSGGETDDARAIFERYADFDISIVRQAWGVKLQLRNAPASAFVDGRMIRGIQEH